MKKENTGKAEKLLSDLGKSIDDLISKAKDSKGDLKIDLDKRINELKKDKESLENELKKFKDSHSEDIEKFEKSVQSAADDIKDTFNKFIGKLKKK